MQSKVRAALVLVCGLVVIGCGSEDAATAPDPEATRGIMRLFFDNLRVVLPLLPDDPSVPANRRAWEALARWQKPFLCAFSDNDPVTRGADATFRERIPDAQGQRHTTIAGGGHFVQEGRGEALARIVADFVKRT
jgi:pimeloyl-ACP methyl ester carboxylesterase